ncbi:MAG TPA: amino acid adenylation domain-containing protein [Bacilli bacterium]|nr:amino acid adenylation domain-containing protein [Bacilli bacterium]
MNQGLFKRSLRQWFEGQAKRTPQAIAVVAGQQEVTYEELNRRANRVAARLLASGIGPDVLVGLAVARSIDLIVGMLGILKAGGAYVPLDPDYPQERLALMIEDAQLRVIVTQEHLMKRLADLAPACELVDVREVQAQTNGEVEENPPQRETADNLAYVIYTSGSTGRPKGVCVPQGAVARLVKEQTYIHKVTGEDRIAQVASPSFDAATFEIWGALLNGARLVILDKESVIEASVLGREIVEQGVTILLLTTALFHKIAQEDPSVFRPLRALLFGGEAAVAKWVRAVMQAGAPQRVINAYGPTECTTIALAHTFAQVPELGDPMPIGLPLNGTTAYVLDAQMQPVPDGEPGELYLGGDRLATGYLRREQLTRERFVPNPFSERKGEVLYKTGDEVRRLPDGALEFVGRLDQQVKIRGYRIELGEVQDALLRHPGVREALVLAREDRAGDKRLVAYVVPESQQTKETGELRPFLADRLPAFMLPSSYVFLDHIPLTVNGKVDQRALPEPEFDRSEAQTPFVAPRDERERLLVGVWQEVLGLEDIGVEDSFLALGGHSLLAAQVVARVRRLFDVEVTTGHLLAAETVARFAQTICSLEEEAGERTQGPVKREEARRELSFAQKRMWLLHQLEAGAEGADSYNTPYFLRVRGDVDVACLERSLQEIVRRHDALRTVFREEGGTPYQEILEQVPVTLSVIDLTALNAEERERREAQLMRQAGVQAFDLEHGPLFFFQWVRCHAEENLLLLNFHHIIADGWSIGVLLRELSHLYAAYTDGKPSPLSELPIQYADYGEWQAGRLQGTFLQKQRSYWRSRLQGVPTVLDLPTDRPRPAVRRSNGAMHTFHIPQAVVDAVQAVGQRGGATLYMTLLAAYQTLLHRYTRQEEVLVGSPSAGRQLPEVEALIGFFANTLVLHADFAGEPSFEQVLQQVKRTAQEAFAHGDYPFEKVVEDLQVERNLSHNPLIQTMFTLETEPPSRQLQVDGLQVREEPVDNGTTKFDLVMRLAVAEDGLQGQWEYSTDLYEADTIERMTGHFLTLLQQLVAAPELPVGRLGLLGEVEKEQVLHAWNATERPLEEACIQQWFERQAERTPDGCALVTFEEQVTYRDLNERANRLAHYLRRRGVGPDVLVGLSVERSVDMVVGLLGILKAGGAYLPLDPNYPQERLAFMVEDAQIKWLVTQNKLRDRLPIGGQEVVELDGDRSMIAEESAANPPLLTAPHHLAYVIYTSGSTGKPKGVLIEHRGLCNLAQALWERFALTASSRVLQFATFNFDASVYEMFPALTAGAALCLVAQEDLLPGAPLHRTLQQLRVTTLMMPPSALAVTSDRDLPDLQTVVAGGEDCSAEVAMRWSQGRRFVNAYGPTEGTVCATMQEYPGQGKPTIGGPLPNVKVYVLDPNGHPVPIGVPGELYIAGVGLARGYLHRPELTERAFLPNPFGNDPEERLYKTGDLVRYRTDGQLDYLGRIDEQVKLRGFRIETGEIAATLREREDVRDALVLVRGDLSGGPRLVAYVIPEREEADERAWRQFLQAKLPAYMVPTTYVQISAWPLTASGKIDRRALPMTELREMRADEAVAPRTETERQIAAVWQEVLGVAQVGMTDNFFELGGHSLLATQAMSRLRGLVQAPVTVRELFRHPTVEELADAIDGMEAMEPDAGEERPIPRLARQGAGERSDWFELSAGQRRLWFLHQQEADASAYAIPYQVRLHGPLSVERLEQSLNLVIARHESLRTRFAERDGKPMQQILPELTLRIERHDLSSLSEPEREQEARRLALEEAIRPFDLEKGSLVRTHVLQMGPDQHIWVLNLHHIIADGWSMQVLMREVTAAYAALERGADDVPLPDLPIQYADYAAWETARMQGTKRDRLLEVWRDQLADAPTFLELPTDHPRPPVSSGRGATIQFDLPDALVQRLRAFGHQEAATLFVTLLSAYQAFLHRLTRQDTTLVGFPGAGRNRPETEGLIGFFVNTLVNRADFRDDLTFRELLQEVRGRVVEAQAHDELPFDLLVEALQVERSLSHHPLVQTLFALDESEWGDDWELPGLRAEAEEIDNGTAKFDLLLRFVAHGNGLRGQWQYATDLFDAATVERMTRRFLTLLEGILADPEQAVTRLPLLAAEEEQRLLHEWNETDRPVPVACLHTLFEEQVARTPEATAISYQGETVTYAELNRRANQVAHHLRERGVGPDVLVGLSMNRTPLMIVGMLGILKAGGAYLPLDPTYPQERLAFMIEDAALPVLLTEADLRDSLPEHRADVIELDRDWERMAQASAENPPQNATVDHLAYVIYTSGSTGKPKGVLIEHRGLGNLLQAVQDFYRIDEQARVLQFSTFNFDASVYEIFPTLTAGATLVMAERDEIMPGLPLHGFLQAHQITTMMLPPSGLAVTPDDDLPCLQTVGGHGEALPTEVVKRWAARGRRFVNAYGPTEATVAATMHVCAADGGKPLLGRPLPNVRLYVLDADLQPVPIGVAGELHVAGIGLARGYLNRDELTAEKFIPHPFSDEPGARLYKTGDLVRYLPDGTLDYLGRIDEQVKLRGFRIELGEIAAALRQHPSVGEAAVIVRDDLAGGSQLVAYVTEQAGQTLEEKELRRFLQGRLPAYMVPAAYVNLPQLPLMANGKVNRRALPAPEANAWVLEEYVAPQNEREQRIADLWREVLGVERIGVTDNFFDLGGHSLLATQLISRMRQELGVELSIRDCFETPTVAGWAEKAAQRSGEGATNETSLAPIPKLPRHEYLPLSFAQKRLWFMDKLHGNSALYNMPSLLRLQGDLNLNALEQSIGDLIARHESLRTVFRDERGEPVQVIRETLTPPLFVTDLTHRPEEQREAEARHRLRELSMQPFDLEQGPLFRVHVARIGAQEHLLLLVMHHIISDGWSMSVWVREMCAFYDRATGGAAVELADLSCQYADYAAWQQSAWEEGDLEEQLTYWERQLSGDLPVLNLPTDHPRPAEFKYRGAYGEFRLSAALTQRLQEVSRSEGVSLFMTMLAAYSALLQRYSGQEEVIVGSPIAGRNRPEAEGLIGFFVNLLPLRIDLSGVETFCELLQRVRDLTLEAYAHQDVPFEKLVDHLKLERDISRTPLFQTVMILQNAPLQDWRLPGLQVERMALDGETAKHDLTFSMEEREGEIYGLVEYNTDLFEKATVERMIEHWQVLLESITRQPSSKLASLPMLGEAERLQILAHSQGVQGEYPADKTLQQLFEQQVAERPQAVAVVFGDEEVTYEELNRRANRLAHELIDQGVEPDQPVGLCLDRSPALLAGMLGILKAGGAYVPLDPEHPAERIALMVEDAQVSRIVTEQAQLTKLPDTEATKICLDTLEATREGLATTNPPVRSTARNLAYVLFTSGSTGRPKGTCIPHYAINRLVCNNGQYRFTPTDRIGQVANASFDAAAWEIWSALLNGSALVVITKETVLSPDAFAEEIERQKLNKLTLATALFHQMARTRPDAFNRLDFLAVGGEAFEPACARLVLEQGGPQELINVYGPTESTVIATTYTIREVGENQTSIPIGRPIPNTETYVLDTNGALVPFGVPGELHIGGDGLAYGYLHREELTAERFIPHPFSDDPLARLYKTGDLVRLLPDGHLEFVGRIDHQVKIRGFRIELGEIEAVLLQHRAVKEALVIAREDDPGDKRLAAYVTLQDGEQASVGDLREQVKASLPSYMVPAGFAILERFPITPNGKVDRKALPKPVAASAPSQAEHAAARNDTERIILDIWQELLQVPNIGIHDNFFDLGGHSLLLAKAHEQIKAATARDFSLMDLFKYPTIAGLMEALFPDGQAEEAKRAARMSRRERTGAASDDTAVAIVGLSGRFPDAEDLQTFWDNLLTGKESLQFFPDAQPPMPIPNIVMAGAMLEHPTDFDPEFFGYTEEEAALIDPQQRLLLECVHEGLEGAGYDTTRYDGRIGLYVAAGDNTYAQLVFANPENLKTPKQLMAASLGNDANFLATRTSYLLNLRGPSFNVQSACTGSAVAIHLACRSLLDGESELAVAAGVNVRVPQKQGYFAYDGGPYSVDGHGCRPLDADATGAYVGEGVGVVVLKRLTDALADGDPIHAVIRATALNNDGAQKTDFSALGMEGIEEVAREALAATDIEPETISYVAGHFMGTPLSDAVEAEAIAKVYGGNREEEDRITLHSIKPNIGHTGGTAGIANVIQTVLAMQRQTMPPLNGFCTPNRHIDFDRLFRVSTEATPWETKQGVPRRAVVNSFAMGGTNAHIILEEAPQQQEAVPSEQEHHLLVLSAKTQTALEQATKRLAAYLHDHPDVCLADVAYTLQTGRAEHAYRRAVISTDPADAADQLLAMIGHEEASFSTRAEETEAIVTLQTLADHWLQGEAVDWSSLYGEEKRRRLALPTYPFEKKTCDVTVQQVKHQ